MFSLKCAVQNYEWGKVGAASEVAKLMQSANEDFEINNVQPYAELWMGTHPSGPSYILNPEVTTKSLANWIQENKDCLGTKVIEKFGVQLPFLFKVLSVNKALSIQAHPNKSHAERLHIDNPDLYKDPNHKPEMAIALTPFEALCGFRPAAEIIAFLRNIPELRSVIGEDAINNFENSSKRGDDVGGSLRACFHALMTCSDEILATNTASLADKLCNAQIEDCDRLLGPLYLRLHAQFPGDVGCFGIYFFNYIRLKPGEAIFLGPNVPHAYLFGDCIESMACSDNVVRAGLTPKYKDISTLCEMLLYEPATVQQQLFVGTELDEISTIFSPPVFDFAIIKVEIPADIKNYRLNPLDSASIILCVSGDAEATAEAKVKVPSSITRGSVVFVSAALAVNLTIKSPDGLLLFRSFANV